MSYIHQEENSILTVPDTKQKLSKYALTIPAYSISTLEKKNKSSAQNT